MGGNWEGKTIVQVYQTLQTTLLSEFLGMNQG